MTINESKLPAHQRYILWLDYGNYEGWRPSGFETLADLYNAIKDGCTFGQPFEVTERLPFGVPK